MVLSGVPVHVTGCLHLHPFHPKQRMRGAAELGWHWDCPGCFDACGDNSRSQDKSGKMPPQPFPSWLPAAPWDSLNYCRSPGSNLPPAPVIYNSCFNRMGGYPLWLGGGQWVEAKVGHWQPKDTLGRKSH